MIWEAKQWRCKHNRVAAGLLVLAELPLRDSQAPPGLAFEDAPKVVSYSAF